LKRRWNFTATWTEWEFMLIRDSRNWPDYFSIGIGPFYIECYWGRGLAPWE
jgi:hypothetical protein